MSSEDIKVSRIIDSNQMQGKSRSLSLQRDKVALLITIQPEPDN